MQDLNEEILQKTNDLVQEVQENKKKTDSLAQEVNDNKQSLVEEISELKTTLKVYSFTRTHSHTHTHTLTHTSEHYSYVPHVLCIPL